MRTRKKKVEVLDDILSIDLGLEEVRLTKGNQQELPIWLIDILESEGYVTQNTVSREEISKYLYQEKQNLTVPASLVQIPWDFYNRTRNTLVKLSSSIDPRDIENVKRISYMVNEITRIRLRKIVQLASLNISDQNLINRMTPEENLVFQDLRRSLSILTGENDGNSTN